jgi:hypothetical protein
MYVIASFEYSISLELAIQQAQSIGIPKENILAVPLDKRLEQGKLFDTIHQSDGISLLDVTFVFGSIFMLLGSIYGFILDWGPIFWAMIGLGFGLVLGFILNYFNIQKRRIKTKKDKSTEVFLMIYYTKDQSEKIMQIMWSQFALGVSLIEGKAP